MRTLEKLVRENNKKMGNHKVATITSEGITWTKYYYYQTVICLVNETNKEVVLSNGGWGTSSTTRAINWYRKYFRGEGYTITNDIE